MMPNSDHQDGFFYPTLTLMIGSYIMPPRARHPVVSSVARSLAVIILLFIVSSTVCGGFVLGPCFVMQHVESFLVLLRKRELVAFLLFSSCCLVAVIVFASSSWCRGLVCSM